MARLKATQAAARGEKARVKDRKQKLNAGAATVIPQVHLVQHSTPRYGLVVGMTRVFATADACACLEMMSVYETPLDPFMGRRLASVRMGDGLAGEAAVLSLFETLPKDVTKALKVAQTSALKYCWTLSH